MIHRWVGAGRSLKTLFVKTLSIGEGREVEQRRRPFLYDVLVVVARIRACHDVDGQVMFDRPLA
jgi:hypothetical protein